MGNVVEIQHTDEPIVAVDSVDRNEPVAAPDPVVRDEPVAAAYPVARDEPVDEFEPATWDEAAESEAGVQDAAEPVNTCCSSSSPLKNTVLALLQTRGVKKFHLSAVQSEQIIACAKFCYYNCKPGSSERVSDFELKIASAAPLIPTDPLLNPASPPLNFLREVCIVLRAGSTATTGAHRTGLWLYRACFQQLSFLPLGHKSISKHNASVGPLFKKQHAKLCKEKIIS